MNEAKPHGNMIIFLLLAFSVAKVRAVTVVGCRGGRVNFTCESLDNNSLPMNRTRIINNTVVVKNLQQEDNGILCPIPKRKEIKIIVNCTNPDKNHTVYNKAQATIECGRPGSSDKYGQVYLCKETGDFDCEDVSLLNPNGKFSMSKEKQGLNVTITNITSEDQGIYWCVEHKELYDRSYRKINITVPSGLSATKPSDQPSEESSSILSIVSLCVCVAVLVLVLLVVVVLVLIRKGKRRNDAPPQNNRQEEYVYEEVPSPTARKAVTTVYATADSCKESLHYMTVDFGKSGNTSEPKPGSSHCQYSTVFNKRADTCAIQAAPPEEPLYCNVNRKY